MKTLNLVYPDKSEIKYRIDRFPDGQQQVTILDVIQVLSWNTPSRNPQEISIYSRLNNWKDLELIIATTASLRRLGVKDIYLYVPYILGARSDRKFEEGGNNYLKDVICPVINSMNFNTVTCIDPHSDVLEACINNFRKESNRNLLNFAKEQLDMGWNEFNAKSIIVSPDAGATKKIYKLLESIKLTCPVIACTKERGVDGKLSKTVIPAFDSKDKNIVIIDDICDGGATFVNIAEALDPMLGSSNNMYLIVTHGIFSKGYAKLNEYFNGIFCTNSYQNIPDYVEDQKTNVKQLNVF